MAGKTRGPDPRTEENCTRCQVPTPVAELVVVQVRFFSNEKPREQLRSGTVAKLCPNCLARNKLWQQVTTTVQA